MYHFRSAHAAASSDAMSTVIDGADQAQYGLPYFAQDDKSTTNGLKYKVWTILCCAPWMFMSRCHLWTFFSCVCLTDKTVCCSCAWRVCKRLSFFEVAPILLLRLYTGPFSHACVSQIIGCPYLTCIAVLPLRCRTLLAYIDKNGKVPGTWFLQLDNTCK